MYNVIKVRTYEGAAGCILKRQITGETQPKSLIGKLIAKIKR